MPQSQETFCQLLESAGAAGEIKFEDQAVEGKAKKDAKKGNGEERC